MLRTFSGWLIFILILQEGRAAEQPCAVDEEALLWRSVARFEHFLSLGDYESLFSLHLGAQGTSEEGDALGFRHILFVVKATKARADMAVLMERVWLHAASNRVFLVDEPMEGLPEQLQVAVGAPGQSDPDPVATSRLLIWLHQAATESGGAVLSPETRWVVLLGDDVFVNLARLYYFLCQRPLQQPVVFAHVLSNAGVMDFDVPCLQGGAVLLNRRALELLGQLASCKECPYVASDDISLGFCAFVSAVPLVHVPAIHCHAPHMAGTDELHTAGMLEHHWIAAGGLSSSTLGRSAAGAWPAAATRNPFDKDFPSRACKLPLPLMWTLQELSEKVGFCGASQAEEAARTESPSNARPPLVTGEELSPRPGSRGSRQPWREPWPSGLREVEVPLEPLEPSPGAPGNERQSFLLALRASQRPELAGRPEQWFFLHKESTWLHRAEIGGFLKRLQASGLLQRHLEPVAEPRSKQKQKLKSRRKPRRKLLFFAFVNPETSQLEADGGLLISSSAATLLRRCLEFHLINWPLSARALGLLGFQVVHTPQMMPSSKLLPRDLHGPSAGVLSGAWSVGQVDVDVREELEAMAEERSFFRRLLAENFADWRNSNSLDALDCKKAQEDSRSWLRFLHDDEEHIKAVRDFTGGKREFRTLHAVYRSETAFALPLHGAQADTVLVARDCDL